MFIVIVLVATAAQLDVSLRHKSCHVAGNRGPRLPGPTLLAGPASAVDRCVFGVYTTHWMP